jgi:hypothetical protein
MQLAAWHEANADLLSARQIVVPTVDLSFSRHIATLDPEFGESICSHRIAVTVPHRPSRFVDYAIIKTEKVWSFQ